MEQDPLTLDPTDWPKVQGFRRWEYKTLAQQDARHIEEKFNELGQEGWEYVAMGFQGLKGHHIFKRPL
jgi:hypothetical protein